MGTRTRRSQKERSETTTTALVDAARDLFATQGFSATQLDQVTDTAGVTKGALYHHFEGKADLFRAVFEREQERLAREVAQAYRVETDPWQGFVAACRAFLEASLEPGVQQITLLDAPSVLGWDAMREIQSRYWLGLVRSGLERAIEAGSIAPRPLEPITHLVVGAVCESVLMLARSEDASGQAKGLVDEVEAFLDALRHTPGSAPR